MSGEPWRHPVPRLEGHQRPGRASTFFVVFTKGKFFKMAQGKPIDRNAKAGCIEQAVVSGNFPDARRAMAIKLARMMDGTDSARDVKSISLTLDSLLDKCEADALRLSDMADTPYAQIMREAEAALANG